MTHHNRAKDREEYWSDRDKSAYTCPGCGRSRGDVRNFEVHHIDGNPANGSEENLVALCRDCHEEVHDMDPGKRDGHWSARFYDEWRSDQSPLMYI